MAQNVIDQIIKAVMDFLGKNAPNEIAKPVDQIPVYIDPVIDWSDPKSKISKIFTVHDATFLPSWGVHHQPTDDQKKAIVEIAKGIESALEVLEKALGRPVTISIHAWIRPEVAICPGSEWDGKDYNRYIYETQVWKDLTPEEKALKVVPKSPHRTGHAVDFHVIGFEKAEGCAKIRAILVPKLPELQLRMENIIGGWVHLDNLPKGNEWFFKPN